MYYKLRRTRKTIKSRQMESESHLVVSDSLRPHGLYSPWNSPGQNTGVGSLSLLQGIFPTQGLNPGLLRCRQILYQLSHKINSLKIRHGSLILSSAIYQDDHFVFHCSVHNIYIDTYNCPAFWADSLPSEPPGLR